jgi:hypothetical protein
MLRFKKLIFSNRHYSALPFNPTELIVNYVLKCINRNGIHEQSSWVFPSPYAMIKVGIGQFSGNKAIQTMNYHLEVKNEQSHEILCYDKTQRTKFGHYTLITDPTYRAQIVSHVADIIHDIENDNKPKTRGGRGTPFF